MTNPQAVTDECMAAYAKWWRTRKDESDQEDAFFAGWLASRSQDGQWVDCQERLPLAVRHDGEYLVACKSGYVTCLNWNGETFYADVESLKTKFWMGEVVAWKRKPAPPSSRSAEPDKEMES